MRGVAVGGVPRTELLGHLLGLIALAVLLALAAPSADASEQVAVAADDAAAPEGDYYTRRAKAALEAEKTGDPKPHPLAAAYPGMDVVVCEAGCPAHGDAEIVFLRSQVISTAEGPSGAEALSKSPACIGGCYAEVASTLLPEASPIGEWQTTTAEALPPRDKLSPIR